MYRLCASALIALITGTVTLHGQSTGLSLGTIQGMVSIAGEHIDTLRVRATWDTQSSDSTFSNASTYSLMVNVPSGTSPRYVVKPSVSMDGNVDYLELPPLTVSVYEDQASTLDVAPAVAFVEGTVTVQNGALETASLSAGAEPWMWRATSSTTAARGGRFRFPIVVGTNVEVKGRVVLAGGASVDVAPRVFANVQEGETIALDIDVTIPGNDGTLQGTVDVIGPRAPSARQVVVEGPADKTVAASRALGAYQVTGLPRGDYDAWVETFYDENRTYFRSPHGNTTSNPPVNVAGLPVVRDFKPQQAFIGGRLMLTGARTMQDVDWATVYVNGVAGSSTAWGRGYDAIAPGRDDFELIVSPGAWRMNEWTYLHFAPDAGVHGYLYILDKQNGKTSITVGAGGTAMRDLSYATGTRTVVLGSRGRTFSEPRVEAICSDIADGETRTNWEAYFYGNHSNVTEAAITFVGIKGQCSVTAFARVAGGSGETSFGEATLHIEPGSHDTIAIGDDAAPPVISVPTNIVREATGAAGTRIDFSVSAVDLIDGPEPVTCSLASGSLFPLGTTLVTCSAQDSKGNTGRKSFSVTVRDTIAPVLGPITPSRTSLWSANHAFVDVALDYVVSDATPAPVCSIAVTSNEAAPASGRGRTSTDWIVVDSHHVLLRAERSGQGDGRVYAIAVTCVDAAGNTSTGTAAVYVPKNQSK